MTANEIIIDNYETITPDDMLLSESTQNYINEVITRELLKYSTPILKLQETQKALIDMVLDIQDRVVNVTDRQLQNQKALDNIQKLLSFKKLTKNWNNNDAAPFSESLIDRVVEIIITKTLIYQPDIFPTARESIQFEYEKACGDYLEFEIFTNSISCYEEINNIENSYENISFQEMLGKINVFYSGFRNS